MDDLHEEIGAMFAEFSYGEHSAASVLFDESDGDHNRHGQQIHRYQRWMDRRRADERKHVLAKRKQERSVRRKKRELRFNICGMCGQRIEQPSYIRDGKRVYAGVRKFCGTRCRDRYWATPGVTEGPSANMQTKTETAKNIQRIDDDRSEPFQLGPGYHRWAVVSRATVVGMVDATSAYAAREAGRTAFGDHAAEVVRLPPGYSVARMAKKASPPKPNAKSKKSAERRAAKAKAKKNAPWTSGGFT